MPARPPEPRPPEPEKTLETRVERLPAPAMPAVTGGSDPVRSRSSATPVSSPKEALHLAEIAQVRLLAGYAIALTGLVAVALPFLHGDPLAMRVHYAGLALGFSSGVWVAWRLRDPNAYRPAVSTILGTCCALAVVSAFLFWGPYSSAIVAVPMGLYLFAAGQSIAGAYIVFLTCAVPHAILAVLVTTGVLEYRGLIGPLDLGVKEQLAALVIAQFVFVATFVLARRVRRTTFGVIEQLERAVRTVAQREALLDEAKRELDRALRVGGPGRFTDQQVGAFRLGNVLGRGAMGEVYEGTHVDTGAPAAVKLLTHAAGSDPRLVERFLREVKIAATLKVPHVVRVLEVPPDDARIPYLAMERLEGETLSDRLRHHSRIPLAEAVELLRQIADGVNAAHAAGIIHRDLKPGNVFRHHPAGEPVVWKILDFGVSKLADASGTLTKGHLVGTPDYMAPEQARGEEVDRRADTYALGVIAYRALTGRPAFSGNDIPAILYAVTHDMPPCPSSISSIGPAFDGVLAIALAKDPAQRFQTAPELAEALAAARDDRVDPALRERADRVMRAHPWGRGR